MRAKELVPILANEWGVPFETAFAVDRSLAEAGLRAKGRGRALPQMTRAEATLFLLGCMASPKSSRAAEEASYWVNSVGHLQGYPDWFVDPNADPFQPEQDKSETTLLDYILWIMHELQVLDSDMPAVDIRLCLIPGRAEVTYGTLDGRNPCKVAFYNTDGTTLNNPDKLVSNIKREVAIGSDVLWEIIDRTEDPLAEEGGADE